MRLSVALLGFLLAACRRAPIPAPDPAAHPPTPSSGPSTSPSSIPTSAPLDENDRWAALARSPDGPLAHPCTSRLGPVKAKGGSPLPIDENPTVTALVQAGRDGQPARVRLRFNNPLMPCPCPEFGVLTRNENGDAQSGSQVLAVFPRTTVDGNLFASIRYAGDTHYVMTGYFSGRMIDHYEWRRQQTGHEEPRAPDEEEFHEWRSRYPEFCVESWCAIPDKDPVGAANPWRGEAAHYGKHLAAMRQAGVLFCAENGGIPKAGAAPARRSP